MSQYFIGIDGGGTSCRAALAGPDGQVLGRGASGAANILTDLETAVLHIVEAAAAACADAGHDRDLLSSCSAALGLAGANVDATVSAVVHRLPFENSAIENDALIAITGALGEKDGAAAILGTGSVFAAKEGADIRIVGGWGFVVGDQGSGAVLGRALMQRALLAHDGVAPGSEATDQVMRDFDDDPQAMVTFAHSAVPGAFARYAPLIFRLAGSGDPVAREIVISAARDVDAYLDVVVRGPEPKLCLLGGLGASYEPWLSDRHRALVVRPEGDALQGAIDLAIRRFSGWAGGND